MFASFIVNAQTIFINEIHYDNVTDDINEGVEIAASAGLDLGCYEIHLYNGSNSSTYGMETLTGTVEDQSNGFGFVWVALPGLQNGSPDGIALYNSCTETLVQFLSYEGMIAAVDGPANGTTSTDIGVEEASTAESGTSLQLTGTGSTYEDFVWSPNQAATNGAVNIGQSFGEGGTQTPSVNILGSDALYSEDAGEIQIPIQATNVTEDFQIIISIKGGTATIDEDFTRSSEVINVSAADGANQNFATTITVNDDEEEEVDETVVINFELDNENVTLNKTSITLTIEDNDAPVVGLPQYSIAQVTTENAEGVADSLEVACQLTGVVQGINLFDTGRLLFTMHDGTAGLSVFNNSTDFGYAVTPGDEITVEGTIDQFNGLTQIAVDALTVNSSDNAIQGYINVTTLDESTESKNVFLHSLNIVDESQWLGDGSSFNVDFTTFNGETVIVRIDNNTPLANTPFVDIFEIAPSSFTIFGIGGQFDNESPYDSGYQLFPFTIDNFEQVVPNVEEVTLQEIGIFPTSKNSFNIEALYAIKNIKAFKMNGKEILVSQNRNEFTLITNEKGIYLVTFEMENKVYSSKISVN